MALKTLTRVTIESDGRHVYIDLNHIIGIRGFNEGQTVSEITFTDGRTYIVPGSPDEVYNQLRLVMVQAEAKEKDA